MNNDVKLLAEMYHSNVNVAEDYADRIMGAGVEEPLKLAEYYFNNPSEIPEPMRPELFQAYFKKIHAILKRKSAYHSVDNQEAAEYYWDHVAKNLPKGLKSDSQILNAAKTFISLNKSHVDSILVNRDKSLANRIVSSYRGSGYSEQEEGIDSSHGWYDEQMKLLNNTSISQLIEDLIEDYEIINKYDIGSYSYDSAQLNSDMILDNLKKRGVSQKVLDRIWDEVESRSP